MTRLLILVFKRDSISQQDFWHHWTQVHAPLVRLLPGLREYRQTQPTPFGEGRQSFDCSGVAELFFDSPEFLQAAFNSEEATALRTDAHEFIDLDRSVLMVTRAPSDRRPDFRVLSQ